MLEKILFYDNKIIVFLNSLGSESFDSFWLLLTSPLNWIFLYVFATILLLKKFSLKKALLLFFTVIISCIISSILVELIKVNVARLRPIYNPEINDILRIVTQAENYSFLSGHSAFSMTFACSVFFIFRDSIKSIWLLFIFPLFFAYSRLYLGVHYLTDVLCGLFLGFCVAFIFSKFVNRIRLFHSTNS